MIDRKRFFDSVRAQPFARGLSSSQVTGMTAILDTWEGYRADEDVRYLAYMLATAYWETAHTMQPIREIGLGRGHSYGEVDPVTKQAYYGRGLVQLTWKSNYEKMSNLTGKDLVADADLALDPTVASEVMFYGMSLGTFTGRKLSEYFTATVENPAGARRIINGMDHAADIAIVYKAFKAALTGA